MLFNKKCDYLADWKKGKHLKRNTGSPEVLQSDHLFSNTDIIKNASLTDMVLTST